MYGGRKERVLPGSQYGQDQAHSYSYEEGRGGGGRPQESYYDHSYRYQDEDEEGASSIESGRIQRSRPVPPPDYPGQGRESGQRSRGMVDRAMIPERFHDDKDGSEIYVVDSTAYLKEQTPVSNYSQHQYNNNKMGSPSVTSNKSRNRAGVVIETMSAPNPFCPNTKGLCCLLVLINLGLILVTLGFSIVLQLFEPAFVWYCGILFLIVGFIALISSLLFLVHLCRESRDRRGQNPNQPGELYWTHHWQKRISLPGGGGGEGGSTIYSPSSAAGGRGEQYEDGRRSAGSIPRHHQHNSSYQ